MSLALTFYRIISGMSSVTEQSECRYSKQTVRKI